MHVHVMPGNLWWVSDQTFKRILSVVSSWYYPSKANIWVAGVFLGEFNIAKLGVRKLLWIYFGLLINFLVGILQALLKRQ